MQLAYQKKSEGTRAAEVSLKWKGAETQQVPRCRGGKAQDTKER